MSSLSETMIIGLTGGIASGKSTVVEMIKEAGYKVIDADRLAGSRRPSVPCLA